MEDNQQTMQDQARTQKSENRSRNPLEPIPFELFSELCQAWMEKYKQTQEMVLRQLRDANAEQQVKERQQTKLSGTMRQYGQIGAKCVKLEIRLGMLEEKFDRTEQDIRELAAINDALWENAVKNHTPNVSEIAQRVERLEQAEKELLNVVMSELQ